MLQTHVPAIRRLKRFAIRDQLSSDHVSFDKTCTSTTLLASCHVSDAAVDLCPTDKPHSTSETKTVYSVFSCSEP